MADNFYFSGLSDHSWFGRYFQPYTHFGYIGDRENLAKYQKQKSLMRSMIEIVAPSINLTNLLTSLAGFSLGGGKEDSQIAKKVITLISERENSRSVGEFLKITQNKCRKARLFFDSVGDGQVGKENPVQDANHRGSSGQLIIVEAELLNRSSVGQFSSTSAQTLKASTDEWMLSDFPAHGLVAKNNRFKGDLLLLREDTGFGETFAQYLPFCRAIGWYPYCRVVGIFDSTAASTEIFSKMSVIFVEYRPPQLYAAAARDIFAFLKGEIKTPIYLDDWSDRILASFLLPIVTWGSNLKEYRAEGADRDVLVQFIEFVGPDMPRDLVGWYKSAVAM